MKWSRLVWHWTLAVGVRFVLVLSGGGEWLLWRPEVSTPANTALKTREGLWLLQYGLSPYSGASCHTPPLWLAIAAPWAHHRVLYALPNIMCDILAAAAVLFASCQLYQPPAKPSHKQGKQMSAAGMLQQLLVHTPAWQQPGRYGLHLQALRITLPFESYMIAQANECHSCCSMLSFHCHM